MGIKASMLPFTYWRRRCLPQLSYQPRCPHPVNHASCPDSLHCDDLLPDSKSYKELCHLYDKIIQISACWAAGALWQVMLRSGDGFSVKNCLHHF